jgi:hypothetical protein
MEKPAKKFVGFFITSTLLAKTSTLMAKTSTLVFGLAY